MQVRRKPTWPLRQQPRCLDRSGACWPTSWREGGVGPGLREHLLWCPPRRHLVGGKRRDFLRSAGVEQVGVANLLHVVAVNLLTRSVRLGLVDSRRVAPEDPVADRALGVRL